MIIHNQMHRLVINIEYVII